MYNLPKMYICLCMVLLLWIGGSGDSGGGLMVVGTVVEIDVSTLASHSWVNRYGQMEYNFAEGDGGLTAGFAASNRTGIKTLVFPGGVYHLQRPAVIDLAVIYGGRDFFSNGVVIRGAGPENTYFQGDNPMDGSAIRFVASKNIILMAYKISGFSIRVDCTGYALSLNEPKTTTTLDWNGSVLEEVFISNAAPGWAPPLPNGGSRTYPMMTRKETVADSSNDEKGRLGGIFVRRWFSGRIQTILAVVISSSSSSDRNNSRATGAPGYNDVAGMLLDEVQYSELQLGGLGSGTYGWALILQNYCYSNDVRLLHVEIAGGGFLVKGLGVAANVFAQVFFSQIRNQQPAGSGLLSHNVIDSTSNSPIGHIYMSVLINTMFGKFDSNWPTVGISRLHLICVDFFTCRGPM